MILLLMLKSVEAAVVPVITLLRELVSSNLPPPVSLRTFCTSKTAWAWPSTGSSGFSAATSMVPTLSKMPLTLKIAEAPVSVPSRFCVRLFSMTIAPRLAVAPVPTVSVKVVEMPSRSPIT